MVFGRGSRRESRSLGRGGKRHLEAFACLQGFGDLCLRPTAVELNTTFSDLKFAAKDRKDRQEEEAAHFAFFALQ